MAGKDSVDWSMNRLMHQAFLREIGRFRTGLVAADGDPNRVTAGLLRRWDFLEGMLRHHHDAEDEYLWPLVRDKSENPQELVILDAMEDEHGAMDHALDGIHDDFARLGDAGTRGEVDMDGLIELTDELQLVFSSHARHEEHEATPLLARYIGPGDLTEFNKYNRDSLYSMAVFPWLADGASAADADAAWSTLPGFVRLFLKPIMNRKYRALQAEMAA